MSLESFFSQVVIPELKKDVAYVEAAIGLLWKNEVAAITPIITATVAAAAGELIANAGNTAAFSHTVGGVFTSAATQIEAAGIKVAAQTVLGVVTNEIATTISVPAAPAS